MALLLFRVFAGCIMLPFGMTKIEDYDRYCVDFFGDPIGIGMIPSLWLTIFAQIPCAIALILGLFSRPAATVLAINMAIFVGYRLKGIKGAVATAFGTAFPSFAIILAIALFFTNFKDNEAVIKVFKGIRPAVVALIAAPCLQMAKSARLTWRNAIIPVIATVLIWLMAVSPIYVIIAGGVGGYLYGAVFRKKKGGSQC